jgi:hypothetical protein
MEFSVTSLSTELSCLFSQPLILFEVGFQFSFALIFKLLSLEGQKSLLHPLSIWDVIGFGKTWGKDLKLPHSLVSDTT